MTLILGQKEALDGTVIIKDMVSGTQETLVQGRLVASVKKLLKNNQHLHIEHHHCCDPALLSEEGEEDDI